MSSFGADLKREREAKGISLKEISDSTKIGVRLLKALEEEQLELLPGGIFDKSFLRQFARYLGLDEERLIGEYLKVTGASAETAAHGGSAAPEQKSGSYRTSGGGFSSGSSGSSSKSFLGDPVLGSSIEGYRQKSGPGPLVLILVVLAVLIAAAAYGIHWYLARRASAGTTQSEAAYPAQEAAPTPSTAQPADAQSLPESAAPPSAEGVPSSGTQADARLAGNSSTAPAGPSTQAAGPGNLTPSATPAGNAAPKTTVADANKFPSANTPLASAQTVNEPLRSEAPAGQGGAGAVMVLQIDARKECWISIAADGKKQWQGTMRAAATRRVEAREAVTLMLGDAGAVALTLNGKPLSFAGRSGEVKTLSISSNGVTQPAP
jgi:cytoskeleton protein RodZ